MTTRLRHLATLAVLLLTSRPAPAAPCADAPSCQAACDKKVGAACHQLSVIYLAGRGVPKDPERAIAADEKACALDQRDGCLGAGLLYSLDRATQAKSLPLLEKACKLGETLACTYAKRMRGDTQGAKQDLAATTAGVYAQLIAGWQKGCDKGVAGDCWNLGDIYHLGRRAPRDLPRAASYFEKGCTLGNGKSCNSLGGFHDEGKLGPPDHARAAALYVKACDAGDADGCFNLGVSSASGEGVPTDNARAAASFGKACDGGELRGCVNAGIWYFKGQGVPADKARARRYFKRACDGGDKNGCDGLHAE